MKIISHRGNITGANSDTENHPDQICKVLKSGFDCEIDLWFVNNCFFLGHDEPQYEVEYEFLYKEGLWIHCKNLEALQMCPPTSKYFWHEKDCYTLTSNNFIWSYPGEKVSQDCIIVDTNINWKDKQYNCYGVCVDYI